VVVAGHSEGALIGTIVAERVPGTAVVTLDGAGRSAPAVLHEQLARQFPAPLVARADSMLALLRAGHTVDTIPPDFPGPIGALFAKPVQPYVISWFRYDPAAELARVSAPVRTPRWSPSTPRAGSRRRPARAAASSSSTR
jgi:pimeloyl-ACP methyl ester carboxylesterase